MFVPWSCWKQDGLGGAVLSDQKKERKTGAERVAFDRICPHIPSMPLCSALSVSKAQGPYFSDVVQKRHSCQGPSWRHRNGWLPCVGALIHLELLKPSSRARSGLADNEIHRNDNNSTWWILLSIFLSTLQKLRYCQCVVAKILESYSRSCATMEGWYVRGLHNSGDSWNSSSPLEAIKDHVNEEIPEIFDKHSGESGMSLHHTAVLAATLERLVHEETVGRLQSAYRTRRKAVDESHDGSDITEIVDAYMLLYLAGIENHTNATPLTISRLERTFPDAYAGWDDTKTWSHGILETTISQKGNTEKVAFADAVQAVETIADKYGKYQNQECLDLKASLMQMERNGTGRVPVEVSEKMKRSTLHVCVCVFSPLFGIYLLRQVLISPFQSSCLEAFWDGCFLRKKPPQRYSKKDGIVRNNPTCSNAETHCGANVFVFAN